MDAKEKILETASRMFLSLGVRNVTMDSLASELGISKRTIYEWFSDKDDLVIQCVRHMILEQNKEHLHIIEKADNVIHALFLIIGQQEQHRKSYPKVFMEDIKKYFQAVNTTFYSCKADLKKFSASYVLLDKGVKQGVFRKDISIELVDTFLHEIITVLHNSERIHLLKPTPEEVFASTMFPYFRGISTDKGLTLINQYFETHFEKTQSHEE